MTTDKLGGGYDAIWGVGQGGPGFSGSGECVGGCSSIPWTTQVGIQSGALTNWLCGKYCSKFGDVVNIEVDTVQNPSFRR